MRRVFEGSPKFHHYTVERWEPERLKFSHLSPDRIVARREGDQVSIFVYGTHEVARLDLSLTDFHALFCEHELVSSDYAIKYPQYGSLAHRFSTEGPLVFSHGGCKIRQSQYE